MAEKPEAVPARVAWWCLLALVAVVPLLTSNLTALGAAAPLTYDQFDLPKLLALVALAGTGLVAWAWSLAAGHLRLRVPGWPALAAVVYLAVAAVATFTSVDPSGSLLGAPARRGGFVTLAFALAAAWLAVQLVDRPSRALRLAEVVVATGAIVSGYGLLQTLGADPADFGQLPFEARRAFATLGNPDLLGGYLVVPLALAPAVALSADMPGRRIAWWAAFGVVAVGWLATFVRGSWIAGALALALVALVAWRAAVRPERRDVIALASVGGAVALVAVLSVATGLFAFSALERIGSLAAGGGSVAQRLSIWSAALAAFAERPVLGWGPDAFRYAFMQHRPTTDLVYGAAMRADDAHSIMVQQLVTTGIVGAIAWAVAVLGALVSGLRSSLVRGGGTSRLIFGAWAAAALGTLAHGLVGVLSITATVLLWIALGVALAPGARSREAAPALGWAAAGLAAALSLAAFFGVARVASADGALISGMVATDSATRAALLEAAVSRAPWDHTYRVRLGDAYAGAVADALASGQAAGDAGQLGEAAYLAALEDVAREHDASLGLAAIGNDIGAFDPVGFESALAAADAGLALAPTSLPLVLERAEALANLERLDEAAAALEPFVDADPNAPEPGVLLVAVLVADGQADAALTRARELATRYPDDSSVANALATAEQAVSKEKR